LLLLRDVTPLSHYARFSPCRYAAVIAMMIVIRRHAIDAVTCLMPPPLPDTLIAG